MGKKDQRIEITKELYDDLKKYSTQFCVGMATQVRDDLTKSAAVAIESFYQDYEPLFYHRHYYNFRDKSFKKYYENRHNHIVRGGVYLSPELMDSVYQDPVEQVFDMVYHGYHGVASGFNAPYSFTPVHVMSPTPLEMIEESRDIIVNHINWYAQKYGYARAAQSKYNTLVTGG